MKNYDIKDVKYFIAGFSLPIIYLVVFWKYGVQIVEWLDNFIKDYGPHSGKLVTHDEFGLLFVSMFGIPFACIGYVQFFYKDNRWKSFGYGFFVGMIPFIFFFLRYQISLL